MTILNRRSAAALTLMLGLAATVAPAAAAEARTAPAAPREPAPPDPAGDPGPGLFQDAPDGARAATAPPPWELRRRIVQVDWRRLRPLCDADTPVLPGEPDRTEASRVSGVPLATGPLTLNLFPDVTVVAGVTAAGSTGNGRGLRWSGTAAGEPESTVTFTAMGVCGRRPERTALAGTVRVNGQEFALLPGRDRLTEIAEIDTAAAGLLQRPDPEPPVPAASDGGKAPAAGTQSAESGTGSSGSALPLPGESDDGTISNPDYGTEAGRKGGDPAAGAGAGHGPDGGPRRSPGNGPSSGPRYGPDGERLASTGGPVIDALVLYTPGAVQEAGGQSQVEAWIEDAANRANDDMQRSGVTATVRVVHMEEVANYSGGETVEPAFTNLTNFHDGQLDNVPALRDKYGADIVTTVVQGYSPDTMVAGLASYPEKPDARTSSDDAYSVVASNQLWAYVLAHEWGHLFGLDHDWRTSPDNNPNYPDNHGFTSPSGSFVTVMGYPSACTPACPYVDYYSTPTLSYQGERLGVPLGGGTEPSDSVRVMNLTAPVLASYRSAKVDAPSLQLRLGAAPDGGGTVQASAPGPYSQGDTVTVNATPAKGYVLAGWKLDGDDTGGTGPLAVRMDRDHQVSARFAAGAPVQNRLVTSASPDDGGEVLLDRAGTAFDPSDKVVATAQPSPGWDFAGWTLDGHAAGNLTQLTVGMADAHRLTARFTPAAKLTVSIWPGVAGDVKFDADRVVGGKAVARAIPRKGWRFESWELDGGKVGTSPVMALTVAGHQTLGARFAPAHPRKTAPGTITEVRPVQPKPQANEKPKPEPAAKPKPKPPKKRR